MKKKSRINKWETLKYILYLGTWNVWSLWCNPPNFFKKIGYFYAKKKLEMFQNINNEINFKKCIGFNDREESVVDKKNG